MAEVSQMAAPEPDRGAPARRLVAHAAEPS